MRGNPVFIHFLISGISTSQRVRHINIPEREAFLHLGKKNYELLSPNFYPWKYHCTISIGQHFRWKQLVRHHFF